MNKLTEILVCTAAILTGLLLVSCGKNPNSGPEIHFPEWNGFVSAKNVSEELFLTMSSYMGPGNHVFSCYIPREDADRISSTGENTGITRYIIASTPKNARNKSFSTDDFKNLKESFQQQYENTLLKHADKALPEMKEKAQKEIRARGSDAAFHIEELVPMGLDSSHDNPLLHSILVKQYILNGDEKIPVSMICTTAITLVRDKILFINVYSRHEGKKDLDWTKKTALEFAQKTIRDNAQ